MTIIHMEIKLENRVYLNVFGWQMFIILYTHVYYIYIIL